MPQTLTKVGAEQQRDAALATATRRRRELANVKRGLRDGSLSLSAVMAEPPDELRGHPLIDIIRWTRKRPNGRTMAAIGRRALADQINLMMPVGDASMRSRAWVAEWGCYGARQSR